MALACRLGLHIFRSISPLCPLRRSARLTCNDCQACTRLNPRLPRHISRRPQSFDQEIFRTVKHIKPKPLAYVITFLACVLLSTTGCSKRNAVFERAKAQCAAMNPGNPGAIRGCEQIEEQAALNCVKNPTPEQDQKCKEIKSMAIAGGRSDWNRDTNSYPPEPRMPMP